MVQPPGPPQPPYGHPQHYPPPPAAPPTNVLAIIALVCAFVFAPAGIVCGIIARRQIQRTREAGSGLALAAIIISAAQIVILIMVFGLVIAGLVAFGTAVSHLPTPAPSDLFPSLVPSAFPTS